MKKCVYEHKCALGHLGWMGGLGKQTNKTKKHLINTCEFMHSQWESITIYFILTCHYWGVTVQLFQSWTVRVKLQSDKRKPYIHFTSLTRMIDTLRNHSRLTGSSIDLGLLVVRQVERVCVCKLHIMQSFFELRSKDRLFLLERDASDTGVMPCMCFITRLLAASKWAVYTKRIRY